VITEIRTTVKTGNTFMLKLFNTEVLSKWKKKQ
jgi:hypothetical protein